MMRARGSSGALGSAAIAAVLLTGCAGGGLVTRQELARRESNADLFGRKRAELRSSSRAPRVCRASYSGVFARKDVRITVAFGYKDARPARFVGDRYERAAFVEQLLQPCDEGFEACGFARSARDMDLFHKSATGPDGLARRVRLEIIESSVTPDDARNRKLPEQGAKSSRARARFLKALKESDVVFYLGHSRDGGGPDFDPPRLAGDGHVHYDAYKARPIRFNEMVETLRAAPRTPRILGLFSCFAETHFGKTLRKEFPDMGLIATPGWAYYEDVLAGAMAALNGVLGMWCRTDLERSLDPAHETKVQGFF